MPVGWAPALPSSSYRRKANPDTKSPPLNTDICGEEILTAKWLKPDESITRLLPIIEKIKKNRTDDAVAPIRGIANLRTSLEVSADSARQTKLMFYDMILLLLASHLLAIRHLNSSQSPAVMRKLIGNDNITCDVPWDETLELPSLPTLTADAKSFTAIFKPEDWRIKSLCDSFSGWSLYATQKELCACNSRLKVRELGIEILVNHILKIEKGIIFLKQLIGLRSEDLKRLEKHYYEDKVPSRFVDSLLIISDVSATFSPKEGVLALTWATNPPKQFKIEKFQKQIGEITQAFLNERLGRGGK